MRAPRPASRRGPRLATAVAFSAAFMLGAALSAGAGETMVTLIEEAPAPDLAPETLAGDVAPAPETTTVVQEAPAAAPHPLAEPEVVEELAPPAQAPQAAAEITGENGEAADPQPETPPAAPAAEAVAPLPAPTRVKERSKIRLPQTASRRARGASRRPKLRSRPPSVGSELEAEARAPGVEATVWLHRSLPDPTPSSKRLDRAFARQLRAATRASQTDWALLLGLLRADGRTGGTPATSAELASLAARVAGLRGEEDRALALSVAGDAERADRALALTHYYRAVGLEALVRGLAWAKPRLEARLLRDDRIATYDGGRFDVQSGRVDVRVLALIAYLADTYGDVTVSCLISGHRLYARPGVVSAHVYGLAVDISSLGDETIAGNQEPGGLTEDAVRNILLLPSELLPRQVISLLGLGGPSFPMSDHGDHIHVGY